MPPASAHESVPVDARAIEGALRSAWQRRAECSPGGVVRAASLTLLIVQPGASHADRVERALASLPETHPCRAIVVVLSDTEPSAAIHSQAGPPRDGQTPANSEVITFEGGGRSIRQVLSAARALVLPGLPVHAWWPAECDLDDPLFPRLVEIADHIVVDSAEFRDPIRELGRYADHSEQERGTVAFADLAWRRLEPWRLLIAQFFDAPSDLAFLSGLETVSIDYEQTRNGDVGRVAEPLLLICWLASRLGWIPVVPPQGLVHAPRHLTFENGAEGVHIELRRRDAMTGSGGLMRVELRAFLDGRAANYVLQRQGEEALTLAEIDGVRREARVRMPIQPEVELLKAELSTFGRDRMYDATLQVAKLLAPPG